MHQLIEDQQDLARWVTAQGGDLDMAVAFWGEGAIEELGLASKQDFRILLDLGAGATNPAVVRRLMDLAPDRVRKIERLHAKAYIGRFAVVVGSANASANGLGLEGREATHWKELSLLTDEPLVLEKTTRWFEQLWKKGTSIEPSDLLAAAEAWRRRRKGKPSGPPRSILDVAVDSPEDLHGLDIYVCVTTEEMTVKGARELERQSQKEGQPLYAYEDWPRIPIDATLISFEAYPGERIQWDEPKVQKTPSERKRSKLKFVTPTRLAMFQVGKFSDWQKRIAFYRGAFSQDWKKNEGLCMEVHEFVAATNKALK